MKTYKMDPYNAKLHVLNVKNHKSAFNRYNKKFKLGFDDAKWIDDSDAVSFMADQNTVYIIFSKVPSIEMIAHEVVHIVHYILDNRGVEIGNLAESYAYPIGRLTQLIYNDLNK